MDRIQRHIIQKQVVDFVINAPGDGFEFQKQVNDLCRDHLNERLGFLLDKYSAGDEVIRLDKLYAGVEVSLHDGFSESLTDQILREIEASLQHNLAFLSRPGREAISVERRFIEMMIFYFREGYLPWWSNFQTAREWHEQLNRLLFHSGKSDDLLEIYSNANEAEVRTRLINTFTELQFWRLVELLIESTAVGLKADLIYIYHLLQYPDRPANLKLRYKDLLLQVASEKNGSTAIPARLAQVIVKELSLFAPAMLPDLFQKDLMCRPFKKLMRHELTSHQRIVKTSAPDSLLSEQAPISQKEDLIEEIYVNNCGLVIIAAYLPMFFKDAGLLIGPEEILDTNAAVALLQYISNGREPFEEFEAVFSKVLCGINVSNTLIKRKVSRSRKRKANELLESVIEHWPVLKNTSVSGLRSAFIQREGRLLFRDNQWHLTVAQESYDMLLSHVPWNIHMIKLPWMNNMLLVDWT